VAETGLLLLSMLSLKNSSSESLLSKKRTAFYAKAEKQEKKEVLSPLAGPYIFGLSPAGKNRTNPGSIKPALVSLVRSFFI
jgi:hypothetical protein